jgi:multidrug resistance efflux pump
MTGAALVIVGGALILSGCGQTNLSSKKDAPLLFSGTIETREIRVGSKAGGRVIEVSVREGEVAEAGQVLARLDIAELIAQRSQAEARLAQQRARLERLLAGARPEEKAQARAATETARANLEAVRSWPRPEEKAQARAQHAAAEAEVQNARAAFERAERLRASGDISQQEFDAAKFRLDNLAARRNAAKDQLQLLLNGSRPEDVRAAEERYRQAQAAEKLVLAGARTEEIADARAQLAEAQARLDQLHVNIAEGEVRAPARALVESISVRPGDLVTPNQALARLLERDQIWVRIYVPEPQLGLIKTGQQARIKVDTFPDRDFEGIVEQINAQGEFTPRNIQSRDERNHQVFGVKVRIDNRDGALKSGMAADVTLENK